MRAVDILWRMAYGPKGGGSPTPPTPSGTVIFDGDVEWSYYEDDNIWVSTFTPDNEPLSYVKNVRLTLNGSDIDGVYEDMVMAFPDMDNSVAQVMYDDAWMIGSFNETEPEAHIKIVQADPEWTTLYSGNVTVNEYLDVNLSDNAPAIEAGYPVRGTINGTDVFAIATANSTYNKADFDNVNCYVLGNSVGALYFHAPEAGTYSLNLEVVEPSVTAPN